MFTNPIKPQVTVVDSMTLTYEEFLLNREAIKIHHQKVKVGNKLFYVERDPYLAFCLNGNYSKYKVNIYRVECTGSLHAELMWIEK